MNKKIVIENCSQCPACEIYKDTNSLDTSRIRYICAIGKPKLNNAELINYPIIPSFCPLDDDIIIKIKNRKTTKYPRLLRSIGCKNSEPSDTPLLFSCSNCVLSGRNSAIECQDYRKNNKMESVFEV